MTPVLNKYLIKNGTVLSVFDGTEQKLDIRVADGIVTELAPSLAPNEGEEVIDASGLLLTTGWVDVHTHIGVIEPFRGTHLGLNPYDQTLTQGITYVLEPGTAGPQNYEEYRRDVRYRSDVRYRAFLNIARYGINVGVMDTTCAEDVDDAGAEAVYTRYRGELCGLKARIDAKFCFDSAYVMEHIRALADKLGVPMLIHAPRCDKSIEFVLSYLKAGDTLTHVFAGHTPLMKVVDENGALKRCVTEARERGVLFDLGHGTNAFSYKVAEDSWAGGFFPDTVSTDLWVNNYHGPCYNMAVVLTKLHGITGLSWTDLLRKVTVAPAEKYRLTDKALAIVPGALADITAFSLDKGTFVYEDSLGETRTFGEKLRVHFTCLGSKVYVNTRTDDLGKPAE